MKSSTLLSLLSDRAVHSGESLAHSLGVSRTAVWKQIRKAVDGGVEIRTIRGQGYQLVGHLDLLDQEKIRGGLSEQTSREIELSVLSEVDSTNAEVARRLQQNPLATPVIIADFQTSGRGRRGRVWESPKGQNLYLSMGLSLPGGFAALDGLSLVLGVAVAKALEALGAEGVGLKWPNDLFAGGQKFAGILVEIQGELQEGVVQVIAGIGINVHMTESEGVDQPWTSLAIQWPGVAWTRNAVASSVIEQVALAASEFAERGFSAFRSAWQARDIFRGLVLSTRNGELEGVGAGIDANGNYLLDIEGELVPVRAGDISLRAKT